MNAKGVRRGKAALSSGCKPHPVNSLPPEAIGAVMEVTKWLKPSISVSRIGDSASGQAATRVNAEQASKRTMCRPTRHPYRGRLIRLGRMSEGYPQPLHRGRGGGPVAKFFRARFATELRSAEPILTQLWVEIQSSESPIRNHKLGHPALSRSWHTGREKFATGPARRRTPTGTITPSS